ncbi:MAG TPA: glycosyltransferase, partial [Pyrinomonadaceae bacterium]|nr:glycosyltransferase [Pyrinomonadaceae bacterium]
WRALGKKIGYTASGCNSGVAQSSVMDWSALGGRKVCDRCVWQTNADVCNDERNLAWGRKLEKHCDLICGEMVPGLDYMALQGKATREPLTTCLDPDFWRPDLAIPADLKLTRERGEILVYHAFGNYDSRALNGRNIKGTPAIFDAIERLKAEGEHVRLIFVTTEHNKQVRYSQAQADIIVDQLNYGRYGATAREGMMLGKPVICYINAHEMRPQLELACLRECPLISATEDTVYATLKVLLANRVLRHDIGKAGRRYAMKWHSADACAERYEKVYDRLLAGLPPVAEEPAASIAADA